MATRKPEKGTPEYAPWHKGTYSYAASIPWKLVDELREAVEGVGIDWREVKTSDCGPDPRATKGSNDG